mgnify:CR=1 FL=1
MINKIYSMIGHFFLRRTDEYWEDRDFNESGEFTSGASTKGTRYTGLNKYSSHHSHLIQNHHTIFVYILQKVVG